MGNLNRKRLLVGIAGLLAISIMTRVRERSLRRRYRLAGKVVIITGGSRGLGLALAESCLAKGTCVNLLARDENELSRARKHLESCGHPTDRVSAIYCDIRDPQSVQIAIQQVRELHGSIDVLINNAGVIHVGPAESQRRESFHESMDVNLYGALNTVYEVMPEMLERRSGQIVNIASIGGLISVPHLLPYSASKFALVGFSRGLSAELAAKGITVLTVCPWLIRTGSHLKAQFTGKAPGEYQWFSAGATLPLISVSAQSTAKSIVGAIESGRSELLISVWSYLAARTSQLAPALTRSLLSMVNRLLPGAVSESANKPIEGSLLEDRSPQVVRQLGASAAARWNQ